MTSQSTHRNCVDFNSQWREAQASLLYYSERKKPCTSSWSAGPWPYLLIFVDPVIFCSSSGKLGSVCSRQANKTCSKSPIWHLPRHSTISGVFHQHGIVWNIWDRSLAISVTISTAGPVIRCSWQQIVNTHQFKFYKNSEPSRVQNIFNRISDTDGSICSKLAAINKVRLGPVQSIELFKFQLSSSEGVETWGADKEAAGVDSLHQAVFSLVSEMFSRVESWGPVRAGQCLHHNTLSTRRFACLKLYRCFNFIWFVSPHLKVNVW